MRPTLNARENFYATSPLKLGPRGPSSYIVYTLGPKGPHITTLGPKYIPYSHMDPLGGFFHQSLGSKDGSVLIFTFREGRRIIAENAWHCKP